MQRFISKFLVSTLTVLPLPLSIVAQVPETVAKITKVDSSKRPHPVVEYMNTGQKNITAVSIRKTTPPEEVTFSDFPGAPLAPGATRTIPVWDDADHINMQIDAVIFEDGTSQGFSIDTFPINGKVTDVVTELFEARQASAQEWARWKNLVMSLDQKDPHKAVKDFLQAVNRLEKPNHFTTMEESGRFQAQDEIRNLAKNIKLTLDAKTHDEAWVQNNMLKGWVTERANEEQLRAKRSEQVRPMLLQFGRTIKELDFASFQSCLDNDPSLGLVFRDMNLASSNDVNATPTLFINGHRLQGVKDAAQLRELIAEAAKETLSATQTSGTTKLALPSSR